VAVSASIGGVFVCLRMGRSYWWRCCQSHQPYSKEVKIPKNDGNKRQQQQDQSESFDEDDIQAVRSWRTKQRSIATNTTVNKNWNQQQQSIPSTELVLYNNGNTKGISNKNGTRSYDTIMNLTTIEEDVDDSRNSPSAIVLLQEHHQPIVEDIDSIPSYSSKSNHHQNHSNPDRYDDHYTTLPTEQQQHVNNNTIRKVQQQQEEKMIDSFPTLTLDDLDWNEHEHQPLYIFEQQKDGYQSSSSNSTIEDPIVVVRKNHHHNKNNNKSHNNDADDMNSNENCNKTKPHHYPRQRNDVVNGGPIDLDDVDSDNGYQIDTSFTSSQTSLRPGPDDMNDDDRPLPNHHHQHHHDSSKQQRSTTSLPSSILSDKQQHELYSVNNSLESEELDAMIAAIDNNNGNTIDKSVHLPSSKINPTKNTGTTAATISTQRDTRSPTFQIIGSLQSSQSIDSGSDKSNSNKLLTPYHKDSPSIHDPSSYGIIISSTPTTTTLNDHINNGPVLILSASDDSCTTGPIPETATMTSTASTVRGRNRSLKSMNTTEITTTTTTILEKPQQRRIVRSLSRGRQVRERARTLLLSYSKNSNNNNNIHETNHNMLLSNKSILSSQHQTCVVKTEYNNTTSAASLYNFTESAATLVDQRSSKVDQNDNDFPSSDTTSISMINFSKDMTSNTDTNTYNRYVHDDLLIDNSNRLSDIPSEVSPTSLERYIKACRILKMSLLESKSSLRPSDKKFITQLLQFDTTTSKNATNNSNDDELTEEKVKQYEISAQKNNKKTKKNDTLLLRSTPLMDTAIKVITTVDDDISPPCTMSPDYQNGSTDPMKNQIHNDNNNMKDLCTSTSAESSGITEQHLKIQNDQYNENITNTKTKSTATVASHISSSISGRISDYDYPYKVLIDDDNEYGNEPYRPKVLLSCTMNGLRGFLPVNISEYNFYLRYSVDHTTTTDIHSNHDTDSTSNLLSLLLSKIRYCTHTIICVETMDGYVFGTFCSTPWTIQPSWYGSGESMFLWRLKHPRVNTTTSVVHPNDNNNHNEIEIYPFTGSDSSIQFCTNQTLAVGGGTDWTKTKEGYSPCSINNNDQLVSDYATNDIEVSSTTVTTGIGFLLDGDLMGGETNSCVTFANPPLYQPTTDNNKLSNIDELSNNNAMNEFEIKTLEVWTLTKYSTIQEANQYEKSV
jgi:hypothetical protein